MEVYIEFLYVFGIVKYVFNMLLFVSVWNSSKVKTHQDKEERTELMRGQQQRYSMASHLSGSKPYYITSRYYNYLINGYM